MNGGHWALLNGGDPFHSKLQKRPLQCFLKREKKSKKPNQIKKSQQDCKGTCKPVYLSKKKKTSKPVFSSSKGCFTCSIFTFNGMFENSSTSHSKVQNN